MLTDLFFKINFSISIAASIIGLILSGITIYIISCKRECRTVNNLLTSNTSLICGVYLIFSLISSVYGLEKNWALTQPACQFRAYGFVVSCTLLLYSHLIHAISRLFFVVFYKHKYLLTWHTHWIMIIINWLLGILIPAILLFIEGSYVYEEESRLCTCTTKKIGTAMYGITTAFIIPFNIVTIIYTTLVCRARQSTRRIRVTQSTVTTVSTNINVNIPNIKREMILVRNMSILLSIILCGGTPYLILVLWQATTKYPPPESFYLLIINSISICTALMMFALFNLNKQAKKTTFECFRKLCKI
ncbi:unnamed protein product [Rotaria sordida]|uniref:G-protein coupled receptors family 1 profile domain-containing protein n=1 Tax=Rotaria sordida TaxID=392033 RepID=A0A819KM71_9BILA|nr:unnamed protein product [Rotaria sordida]